MLLDVEGGSRMTAADHQIMEAVRRTLSTAGDLTRALDRQRYMKSELPYYGIAAPQLKALLRPLLAAHPPAGRAVWEATIRTLWDEATHREERYAATAYAKHRAAKTWLDPESLDLFRHLIVTGAWWDHVDDVATHLVREVLAVHRSATTPVMLTWAREHDPWLRRAAVICQVGLKERTDLDLLGEVVEANVHDESFWLRKGIGWALRDQAWTNPDWVRAEVDLLGHRLSGLSRREALKNLG
jgi:3-methyladenine DNA glycosylase AlkD